MAEPNARPDGMAMVLIAAPPPVTSSRWVGRGPIRRILFNSFNWLRKKIFIDGIYFILFFASSKLDHVQNNHVAPPLQSPPVARPFVTLPRCARMFLVGCCLDPLSSGHFKATMYFIFYFHSPSIGRPVRRDQTPPHVPPQSRLSSPASSSTVDQRRRRLIFDCCVHPFKWRPSKANGPPVSLNFCH
jgi:hypothetical protein